MKKALCILLLLLTATPASTHSAMYEVSCNNVERIRIARVRAAPWGITTSNGCFHVLVMDLKKKTIPSYIQFRNTAPSKQIPFRGHGVNIKDIVVTASGVPLRNDAPTVTGFADEGINIPIIREEDAFEAAHMVCPALVPDKVLIEGQLE